MTERNRKQEESRSASKPRPAYHPIPSQLAAPGSTILPHPGTHLAPDVAAGLSASSFGYPMIQPSFQTHIVVPTLHRQNSRTNPVASLTADPIGPPMFMPSLNLGVPGMFPSSSSSSNPSHTGKPTSASNSSNTSNSFAFQPTSLSAKNPVKMGDGNGSSRTPQPLPSVQSVKQAAAVHGRGSPPLPPSSSISLVKPTIASSTELSNAAGGHMTYTTPLYPSPSGMIGMTVGGGMVVAGSNSGIMTAEGLFTCQGQPMPHGNLLCTEGVPLSSASSTARPTAGTTAVSSNNSSSSSSSSSTVPTSESFERPVFPTVLPVNTNHRFHSSHPSSPLTSSDSMLTTYHHHAVRPSHIPRPEAVSKNIIIPAPNLTGKDIASLTSSAHSSEANTPTSERPSNDLCLSGSDSLPHETPVTSAPPPPSVNRIPLASMVAAPSTRTLSSPSSPSLPSGGLSLMDTSVQQGSSSPRPSILRKRPLDRQTEGLSGTVSPSMFLTNPLRTTTSSAVSSSEQSSAATSSGRGDSLENHLKDAEFTSSPRKRPRKQHFDNIGDNYYGSLSSQNEAQGSGVTSPLTSLDAPHPSIFANERLPGPLPLKTKTSKTDLVSPVVSEAGDDKAHKEVGVLYLAQLRKSPYPINGCLRINHRAAHSHFKRHADIKHREETRTSLHEIASSDSSWLRASGWKIELFERNLQEMKEAEGEVLEAVQRIQSDLSSLLSSAHCSLPAGQTRLLQEVIQGNVDRSTRVQSHVDECSEKMLMVLDHSPRIMDLLKRYGGSRTNYSASAKHHT